jgi:hypothetical protein
MVKKSWTFISKALTNFASLIKVFLPPPPTPINAGVLMMHMITTGQSQSHFIIKISAYLYITLFPAHCLILGHVLFC